MTRRRFLSLAVTLILALSLTPSVAGTGGDESSAVRLLVKLRPVLAKEFESALPLMDMTLAPGSSGNSQVENFLSRHAVRKITPLYPQMVRLKRVQGLSDLEIATGIRQKFGKRASRLRGPFQPPEISRTYLLDLAPAYRQRLSEILSDVKADPDVEFAEEDKIVSANLTPNDPFFSTKGTWGQSYDDLWGIKKIGSPAAWDTNTGEGIIVAVVDTGIDYNHPDIAANVWMNTGEIPGNGIDDDHNGFIDDVRGWDFVGPTISNPQQSNNPIDHNGHGTHVSGTIAAIGNNGVGVIGVAWHAQVMAVKGLDDQGEGLDSTLAPAILYAANNGADVINASWGGPGTSQTIAEAVNFAYNLGAVFVAAAGNDSGDALNFQPASLWNAITVAASDPNDVLAPFSNFGSKIDVTAPGVDILSLQAAGTAFGTAVPAPPGTGTYTRASGTSMAAPHVSGLAALILSQNPNYSNEDVRQVLRVSATDLGTPGFDLSYGYGRINASAALGVTSVLEAKISSPIGGALVQSLLTITGVAQGSGFSNYTLEYGAGALPTTWTKIQTGNAPVMGTLGQIDTKFLADGVDVLRLTAVNNSGQSFVDRVQVLVHNVFIQTPSMPPSPTSSATFKNGVVIPVTGTAVGATFQNFVVEWAPGLHATSGWQTAGITLTGGGASPVTSAALANWDTTSITTAGYYTVRLTVNNAGSSSQSFTVIYLEPDLLSSNWPQFLDHGPQGGAGVLPAKNADGSLRLVLEGPRGLGAGTGEFWTLPLNGPAQPSLQPGPGSFIQPTVADFNGNPGEEAMVLDFGDLQLFHADGTFTLLASNPNLSYWGSQLVTEDLAGDSHWTTLGYGIDFNNQVAFLSAWRPDGTSLNSNFPIKLPYLSATDGRLNRNTVLVGDIDGDGKKEIVAMEDLSPTTFTLALFANDGSPLTWNVPVLAGAPTVMAAADLDNNGKLETILAANSDTQTMLHVFQPDGSERPGWPLTLPNTNAFSQSYLAVGDLNQDGHKEIVYSHEAFLYVFKDDGTNFSSAWPQQGEPATQETFGYNAVVIGDVDGDGFPEIVTVLNTVQTNSDPFFTIGEYGDEKLLAIRKDGTISKSWQLNAGNGCFLEFFPTPAIGDFKQDGTTDIAVAYDVSACSDSTPGVVTILSTGAKFNPANDWPFVRHDPRNTSVLQLPTGATSSTLTTIMSSPNPSVFGQSVNLVASVTASSAGASTPSGQVNFLDGTTMIASCSLSGGSCDFVTPSLAVGTHTIFAQYAGDTHSTVSLSTGLSQVVNSADFSMSASTSPAVNAGSPASYTITVAPNPAPYSFPVTNFTCSGLPTGTSCTFNPTSVTPGNSNAPTMLTITTTSRTLAMARPNDGAIRVLFAAWLSVGLIGTIVVFASSDRKKRATIGMFLGVLFVGVAFAVSCGGGSSSPQPNPEGTPAGTYNIEVMGTGNGGSSHSTMVTLKVN
jgi:subtilisin family serine protease